MGGLISSLLDNHQTLIYYRAKPGVPSFNELGVNSRVRVFVAGHFLHLQGCVLSHLLHGGKGVAAGWFLLQPKYHLITIENMESSKFEVWSFSCKTRCLPAGRDQRTAYHHSWSRAFVPFTCGAVFLAIVTT